MLKGRSSNLWCGASRASRRLEHVHQRLRVIPSDEIILHTAVFIRFVAIEINRMEEGDKLMKLKGSGGRAEEGFGGIFARRCTRSLPD